MLAELSPKLPEQRRLPIIPDLMGTLIEDIVLQLHSYAAQAERDFIRQRRAGASLAVAHTAFLT